MITDTKAIVLRQVRTLNSRRVITLFTEKFGKISAGVTVSERGRNKSSLAMQAFTYGHYELFKSKDYYHLNKGQVIRSHYDIGRDVDKYLAAGQGLELLNKALEEWEPMPELFRLTLDFLDLMEKREKSYGTLVVAYKAKMLALLGYLPAEREALASLLLEQEFAIIDVLIYLLNHPITKLEKLALDADMERDVNGMIDRFLAEHLDIEDLASTKIVLPDAAKEE